MLVNGTQAHEQIRGQIANYSKTTETQMKPHEPVVGMIPNPSLGKRFTNGWRQR